jgi:hypothetical protein
MHKILTLFCFLVMSCSSLQVIPEPTLDLVSVKSSSFCPTWNWHPFCVETKPNSIFFTGTLNNSTSEKRYYLDYFQDSFDTDIPIGISLKIDGTYYVLKKISTEYSYSMKLRSEISEEMIKILSNTNQPISLSYSNRKSSLNFDLTMSETEKVKNNLREVVEKINSMQKLKIIR